MLPTGTISILTPADAAASTSARARPILVDGFVAGMWRARRGARGGEAVLAASRAVRQEVEDEAARLEPFLAE